MCDCGNFSILEYIERGFSRFLYPWWHPKLGHIGRMLGDRRCRVSPLSLESLCAFSVLGVSVCNHAAPEDRGRTPRWRATAENALPT